MTVPPEHDEQRQLHPLPKGLVELYGLIAVLMVLIPEWLADGTLSLRNATSPDTMPVRARAWRTIPELRLAAMSMLELRQLARQLRLYGYAAQNRDRVSGRLLRKLRRIHNAEMVAQRIRRRNSL